MKTPTMARRRIMHPRRELRPATHTLKAKAAPGGAAALRFVPLGGFEEIGRNMMFFEYNNEIVVVDAGLQFPEEETPGIDYIIPNTSYLEERKANIQALILTHAHYDHIGAVPHLIEKLGNPPIYASALTKAITEKRHEDYPNVPKLKIQIIKAGETVKLSNYFEAEFFDVAHNIPETTGVLLKTPIGNVVHVPDFKIDYDEKGEPRNLHTFEAIGKKGIHTLIIDSTNAEEAGYSLSERAVEKNIADIFKGAKGRIIVASFASLLTRIAEIIKIAEKMGRKVALSGYSMKTNVQIAQNLGFIKAKGDTMIPLEEIQKYRDDKLVILSTGAQGESNASLMRIINGEHRHLQIKEGDTIIFSSSIIPGNERSVQVLKDNLSRQGAIVYHSKIVDIHSSGHAPREELKLVMKLVKPKFVVPAHGYYFLRAANAKLAQEVGIPKEHTFVMDNGQAAELTKEGFRVTSETVPAYYVMVDGIGVGDVQEVVLRDRLALAQEGMLVVIVTLDRRRTRLLKSPDIISRGFIYLKENQEILEEMRKRIRGLISRLPSYQPVESDYVKTLLRDQLGQFIYNRTKRRPMILPVVIEI
jgi:ribonuclease J